MQDTASRQLVDILQLRCPPGPVFPGFPWQIFDLRSIHLEGRYAIPVLRDGRRLEKQSLGLALAITDPAKGRFPGSETVPLAGTFMPLCGRLDDNYYHWTSELAPVVLLAELLKIDCTFLLPPAEKCPRYIRPYLEILGVPAQRLLHHPGADLVVERYLLPHRHHGTMVGRVSGIILEQRRRMLEHLGITPRPRRRIYITRRSATRRRILNEEKLEAALHGLGFETIEMEKMSVEEQIRTMADTEAVVFPHGAALANQLFLPKEAVSIELFSPYYVTTHSQYFTLQVGFRYFQAVNEIQQGFRMFASRQEASNADFEANIDFVRITLARELPPA